MGKKVTKDITEKETKDGEGKTTEEQVSKYDDQKLLGQIQSEMSRTHCMFLSCHIRVWLSVRLRTKWFWVRVHLQSLHLQISRLLRARSSFTFRQL